jgi:hypothetical protein
MTEPDDQAWLDALAGRDVPDENGAAQREARALRVAILSRSRGPSADVADAERGREDALIARARGAGLLGHAWASRNTGRALAAVALLGIAVAFFWMLREPPDPPGVSSTTDTVHRVETDDVFAFKSGLMQALREAGVEPKPYEVLGRHGIDAELPTPVPPQVRAVLDRFGIPEPTSGELRVEIEPGDRSGGQ